MTYGIGVNAVRRQLVDDFAAIVSRINRYGGCDQDLKAVAFLSCNGDELLAILRGEIAMESRLSHYALEVQNAELAERLSDAMDDADIIGKSFEFSRKQLIAIGRQMLYGSPDRKAAYRCGREHVLVAFMGMQFADAEKTR